MNGWPKRESTPIEEATTSNMWENAAIVKILERMWPQLKGNVQVAVDTLSRFRLWIGVTALR